ncbi:MAG: hypothetical protein EZS28_027342 [Streblomastix strix]|uniref:Uncharacterized protein n=1 Tax=Streblomastix strix TaxID=222440 RepID=A0A5J4V4V6_9EUKA|nr:MAG: hypothetical protein EZS28_027342 [Streblomastix strix]
MVMNEMRKQILLVQSYCELMDNDEFKVYDVSVRQLDESVKGDLDKEIGIIVDDDEEEGLNYDIDDYDRNED